MGTTLVDVLMERSCDNEAVDDDDFGDLGFIFGFCERHIDQLITGEMNSSNFLAY